MPLYEFHDTQYLMRKTCHHGKKFMLAGVALHFELFVPRRGHKNLLVDSRMKEN